MNEKNRNVYNLQALGTTITYQVNWHFLLLVNIKTGCGNFLFWVNIAGSFIIEKNRNIMINSANSASMINSTYQCFANSASMIKFYSTIGS